MLPKAHPIKAGNQKTGRRGLRTSPGRKEMAPGCSGGSLDQISGTIPHCGQALRQVSQGSGGVTTPGTF